MKKLPIIFTVFSILLVAGCLGETKTVSEIAPQEGEITQAQTVELVELQKQGETDQEEFSGDKYSNLNLPPSHSADELDYNVDDLPGVVEKGLYSVTTENGDKILLIIGRFEDENIARENFENMTRELDEPFVTVSGPIHVNETREELDFGKTCEAVRKTISINIELQEPETLADFSPGEEFEEFEQNFSEDDFEQEFEEPVINEMGQSTSLTVQMAVCQEDVYMIGAIQIGDSSAENSLKLVVDNILRKI